ncbi:MAG: hypothetical protein CML50_02865 [Rhodobacteraceae bacterium]|nr:hypothetical protein [Paracoccaceae bacterium]HCR93716.1 hypothetical protein [Oceanicaulis sp.]
MKVIHFPGDLGTNPYQKGLIDGLCAHGVDAMAERDGDLAFTRIAFSSKADILHLHWMYPKLVVRSVPIALMRFLLIQLNLVVWRLRGKKIVWTIHELQNHENRRVWLDRLNCWLIARICNRAIVHGPSAVPLVVRAFGIRQDKLAVILHPNYAAALEKSKPPIWPTERMKILFFGLIREYKGVPELIRAFRDADLDGDLHICGKPYNDQVRADVEAAAASADNVTLDLRFIPDDELQVALDSCHVIALPFTEVFTSGSVVMAISAARAVIAPRIGLICDYLDDSCAFLFDPDSGTGLSAALQEAAGSTEIPKKAAAARARAEDLSINHITAQLKAVYDEIL